jgi:hypothetical protein
MLPAGYADSSPLRRARLGGRHNVRYRTESSVRWADDSQIPDFPDAQEFRMSGLKLTIALSLLSLTFAAASLHAADAPQVRQSGSVNYLSGGVSEESRDSLQVLGAGFNLKLILATKNGAYLSDVNIVVNDAQGRLVLEAKSDGPWFYAKLPDGKYQIAASTNGKTVRKSVSVGAQSQSRVDFRWAD